MIASGHPFLQPSPVLVEVVHTNMISMLMFTSAAIFFYDNLTEKVCSMVMWRKCKGFMYLSQCY